MKLHFVESMDEVLKIALEREIVALPMPAAPRRRNRDRRRNRSALDARSAQTGLSPAHDAFSRLRALKSQNL